MPTLTTPNTFTASTPALSAEINANFQAIATLLNSTKLNGDNLQTGGVPTAALADGAVTKAKTSSDIVDGVTLERAAGGELQVKDEGITLAKLAAAIAESLIPTSTILAYGGDTAPTGYLLCDGTAVSRTGSTAALFAVVGVAYGVGDGTTTFNVPDFRGRTIIGAGTGSSLTARTRGQTMGTETHTLTEAEMPSHTHGVKYQTGVASGGGGGVSLAQDSVAGTANYATNSTGSSSAHNNMQPSGVASYIIKL